MDRILVDYSPWNYMRGPGDVLHPLILGTRETPRPQGPLPALWSGGCETLSPLCHPEEEAVCSWPYPFPHRLCSEKGGQEPPERGHRNCAMAEGLLGRGAEGDAGAGGGSHPA